VLHGVGRLRDEKSPISTTPQLPAFTLRRGPPSPEAVLVLTVVDLTGA
jgi:hypothetical protein